MLDGKYFVQDSDEDSDNYHQSDDEKYDDEEDGDYTYDQNDDDYQSIVQPMDERQEQ